jgi:hypothetical protein
VMVEVQSTRYLLQACAEKLEVALRAAKSLAATRRQTPSSQSSCTLACWAARQRLTIT